jgi:glycosyltransferase involved in cell wall biosynthesis
LVPPGDVEALANRIRWVLSHPGEAQEMGRRGREFASRCFSPDMYVRRYASLFEMAMDARS